MGSWESDCSLCYKGSVGPNGAVMGTRILLVEDEEDIADFVTRGLREEGYVVERESNGIDGWKALSTQGWELVLLDWWLPGIEGISLLKRFRDSGNTTPVIFLTARDDVADRVQGLDCGANDYLCKPFAFEELLARIRVLLRPRGSGASNILSHGDISLDLVTRKAQRAGRRLDLTAKEEALLLFFLRHPGEVLSRPRIYEQVWEDVYDGTSNTLEVHIAGLRKRLESAGPKVIHTLRGQGYVFGDSEAV